MRTYLFTWNENRWRWPGYDEFRVGVASGSKVCRRWSCGNTKRIRLGDRAFLIRLGLEPKGLIGSGIVVGEVFDAPHWDPEKANRSEDASYVNICFDDLVDYKIEPMILRDELISTPFDSMHWDAQSSGTEIPSEITAKLEKRWYDLRRYFVELKQPEVLVTYREGTRTIVPVSRYERNPAARAACLAVFGSICRVCLFDFETQFGPEGRGIIHVHHLKELSSFDEEHFVDVLTDLIPLCPNCHTMIHSRSPEYAIDELRNLLPSQRQSL